jgi:predicted nucleotidyltransferase
MRSIINSVINSWAVTTEKVQSAVQRIIQVSRPKKLILFGSYIRKTLNANSDLDVLVIVDDTVTDNRRESIRIRQSLKGISMPMDILVIPEGRFKQLSDVPGLIYREALRTGQVVYEAA